MTRYTLSHPQRPFYEPHRYRPTDARRRYIHGPLRPMHECSTGGVWWVAVIGAAVLVAVIA